MLDLFKKAAVRLGDGPPDWDALEAGLIQADFGAAFAIEFVETLRKEQGLLAAGRAEQLARNKIRESLADAPLPRLTSPLHLILVTGVNGVGKTTSCSKLAAWHAKQGAKPRLVAADTFRAAAVEQLQLWGQRLAIPVTAGAANTDPASVGFAGVEAAQREGQNLVIVDTAGRQHTKHNLMQELSKISRTLGKACPGAPHETLLVVDASTGGNALVQAREFSKATPLTGLIVTKMDGVGTGGSLFAIRKECGVAPLWVGTGEGATDFSPFHLENYLDRLFGKA